MTVSQRPYSLIKNSLYVFIIRGVGALLTLGLSILISRELGASEAGLVFLAWSIAMICSTLARNGYENTMVRFISIEHAQSRWHNIKHIDHFCSRTVLHRSIVITLILLSLSPIISNYIFFDPGLTQPLFISALAIFPLSLILTKSETLRGLKQVTYAVFLNNVAANSLSTFLLMTIVAIGISITAAQTTTLYLAAAIIIAAITVLLVYKTLKQTDTKPVYDEQLILQLGDAAKPMLYIALLNMALMSTDTLMIGIYLSSDQVAIYKLANHFAILITFMLAAVNSVIAPQLAELHANKQHKKLAITMQKNTLTMILITTPILIGYFLLSEQFLALAGDEFATGNLPLLILACGFFIHVITGSVGNLLLMSGHERVLRNNVLTFFIINILLNAALIPFFGIVGAAIATAISIATMNLKTAYSVHKHLGINVYDYRSLISRAQR